MKRQAKSWLEAAKDDLKLNKEIIGNKELTHMVAFHSQQAIEKSFKAILEEKESLVPKMHDLIPLRKRISHYIEIKADEKVFKQINELYIDARYPNELGLLPDGKPDKAQAVEFNEMAKEIYSKIKSYLENKQKEPANAETTDNE